MVIGWNGEALVQCPNTKVAEFYGYTSLLLCYCCLLPGVEIPHIKYISVEDIEYTYETSC